MERVMLLIVLLVSVVLTQSLTTKMLKEDVIFQFAPVSGSICGITDVVVIV